jgi:hypothetical protein
MYTKITRATLLQNTPVTKVFDRYKAIIDMHIEDMLWSISGKMDILSSLVTLNLQIITLITCVTLVVIEVQLQFQRGYSTISTR